MKVSFSGALNATFPYWMSNAGYAKKKARAQFSPRPEMCVLLHRMKKA
jgi:hypothetical protein